MRIVKNRDVVSGSLLFVLALWALYDTRKYDVSSISSYGNPAVVPRFVITIVLILAILILADGVKLLKQAGAEKVVEPKRSGKELLPIVFTVIILSAYILCLKQVGFVVSTIIYMSLQMYILSCFDRRKLWMYFLIAFVTTPLLYWMFRTFFNVLLPAGVIPWYP